MSDRYDYSAITTTAQNLIYKFGSEITLIRSYDPAVWAQTYDPITGSYYWTNIATGDITTTQPANTSHTGQGVMTKFSIAELSASAGAILATDGKLLAYGTPEPEANDIYTVNGVNYKCVNWELIVPATDIIIYKIQVRI